MKKQVFSLILGFAVTIGVQAQTFVSVKDIQFVSATDLANCDELSSYDGQTVRTVGVVMHDGSLTELESGSVNGGYRPGVHILDTAARGKMGDFGGVQIHGVYQDASGNSQPVTTLDNLVAGMIIEVTGEVSNFRGETQIFPDDNSAVRVLGTTAVPAADTITIGVLNDNSRVNKIETGEQWEGSLVTLENVTVVSVSIFSGDRVSFDVTDASGNTINVSDRFLVQKQATHTTVNNSSPSSTGSFVPPVVGTQYASITGIIMHSENGCTGGTGRGYEINPFDTSHYKIGDTPPSITEVTRNPSLPKSSEAVVISAKIIDFNGTVTDQTLYYSTDMTQPLANFTSVPMTLKSGSTDEFEATVPAQADGSTVRYYIKATDNDGNDSYEPFSAANAGGATALYLVRDNGLSIMDIQRVIDPNVEDASPFEGEVVTVRGFVTASAKPYDLESIYIQDKDAQEYAGIHLYGSADLIDLWRTEEVEVTGTVEESFGFTRIAVESISKTGETAEIQPIELPVNDPAGRMDNGYEKYESMLVRFVNDGGKVKISNPRLNPFAEFTVSDDTSAVYDNSAKVQAGSKNGNNNSSLWVSLVTDSSLAENNGLMEVPVVITDKKIDMDAIQGILYYGFSQYACHPRNNDDIIGLSVALEPAKYAADTSTNSVKEFSLLGASFYPNPANDKLTISLENAANAVVVVRGLDGRLIATEQIFGTSTLNISELVSGIYFLELTNENGQKASAKFIKL